MTSVQYENRDGAAYLTLVDSARGNPVDMTMVTELRAAIDRAGRDDARVVVLKAEGKAFSVGGDIAAFGSTDDPGGLIKELADNLHGMVLALHDLDAVVVTVVRATAAGAGAPLALAGDIVLASDKARFTLAYTKIGLTPDGGSSLLMSSIGLQRSLYLALMNPLLSAAEAQAMGMVSEVLPDDEIEARAEKVVGTLLAGSRSAQISAKRLLRARGVPDAAAALDREAAGISEAASSPDGREGVRAFLDKRAPVFPSNG